MASGVYPPIPPFTVSSPFTVTPAAVVMVSKMPVWTLMPVTESTPCRQLPRQGHVLQTHEQIVCRTDKGGQPAPGQPQAEEGEARERAGANTCSSDVAYIQTAGHAQVALLHTTEPRNAVDWTARRH